MASRSIKNENHRCKLETISCFRKGETILSLHENPGKSGILLEGEAHLAQLDSDGTENILEVLSRGDSFGAQFLAVLEDMALYILADSDCRVMFLNVDQILHKCPDECSHHTEMMQTLVNLSSRYAKNQSIHLNILSQRTLRAKLMTYLLYQQQYALDPDNITIPISLVNLASYLCVDRSAMMREIKKMNEDGLIRSSGRVFTILRSSRNH